jgi:protein-tyrosine phosphatase
MKEEYGSINQFMIKGLNISMQQKEDFKQKVLE